MDIIGGLIGLLLFFVFGAVVIACWIILAWAFWDLIIRKHDDSEIRQRIAEIKRNKQG